MTKAADLALGKIAAVKTALIEFTDGDDAIAVADGGIITVGNNAIATSDGGAVTQNLVQGLAKAWANAPGAATSINDSFNTASLTDTGTGNAQFNFTNNMSGTEFSFTAGHQYTTTSGTGAFFANPTTAATSYYKANHYQNAAEADPLKYTGLTVHGDLA